MRRGKLGTAKEAVRQRRDPPRRTLPARPATAAAADELAAQQETGAQAAGERLTAADAHLGRIEKSKLEITSRKEQAARVSERHAA